MPQIAANGITLEYETHGDPANPPMLLVMGLGAQLTLWPIEFVEAMVARGFYVIRYDNRDIGLSTKFPEGGEPNLTWVGIKSLLGIRSDLAYQLSDMAKDGIRLLDTLGIEKAHIVGASMGGMIAQLMASEYAGRVASLTSVMSTSGNRKLPRPKPEALAALLAKPERTDLDSIIAHGENIASAIGSPAYPPEPQKLRDRIELNFRRSFYPQGLTRQAAAIIADGDRRKRLAKITAPTLVIHGVADPLVPVEAGQDTADHIAGAKIKLIEGMGHDLPQQLIDEMADSIAEHAKVHGPKQTEPA